MPDRLGPSTTIQIEPTSPAYQLVESVTAEVASRLGRGNPWGGVLVMDRRQGAPAATVHPDGAVTVNEHTFAHAERARSQNLDLDQQRTVKQALGDITTQAALLVTGDGDPTAPSSQLDQITELEMAAGAGSTDDQLRRSADQLLARGLADGWTSSHLTDVARATGVEQSIRDVVEEPYKGQANTEAAANGLVARLGSYLGGDRAGRDRIDTRELLMLSRPQERFATVADAVLRYDGSTLMPAQSREVLISDLSHGFSAATHSTDPSQNFRGAVLAVEGVSENARLEQTSAGRGAQLLQAQRAAMRGVESAAVEALPDLGAGERPAGTAPNQSRRQGQRGGRS